MTTLRTVGLVGAGHMGAGVGWALREGGHDVVTSLHGRSARTARLAADAGLRVVPRLADVVAASSVILVVTPPSAALTAAADIAAAVATLDESTHRTSEHADLTWRGPTRPVVVDLNAIAPATARAAGEVIEVLGLDFVDGSISGPPPTVRPGARIYLSGRLAAEIADLGWKHVSPVVVSDQIGAASAVKMSTASVYKGLMGLMTQAMRSASHHGVLDVVMSDLGTELGSPYEVGLAATKAHRYVAEMHEIAKTQEGAGLTPSLFEAFAEIWADVMHTSLARGTPESLGREITAEDVARLLGDHDARSGDS